VKVSIIIPVYNEEKVIGECLKSLAEQSYKDMEIIVVDDGSVDKTMDVLSKLKTPRSRQAKRGGQNSKLKILEQNHQGPGMARNLGAKYVQGEILVFVDADMVFDKNFITELTKPIREGKTIGTFSREEYVLNKDNVWSKCWNIQKGLPLERMHPKNYPDKQPVFRAILKKEFERARGFTLIGYIDDYTLAEKLGVEATVAPGAIFYHKNPQSLREIYQQARWIGKSEFKKRKIKNETLMKSVALLRYNAVLSLFHGIYKAVKFNLPQFLIFKIIYDLAIEISLLGSFFGEQRYK